MTFEDDLEEAWQGNPDLAGLPVVDPDAYRAAMRGLASGVSVITTCIGDRVGGLTATAVCAVTAAPARVVVFVNKNASANALILESGSLCVNLLAAEQEDVARTFAGMVPDRVGDDRFLVGEWSTLATGAPALTGALASMDCRVIKVFDESSHRAFVCELLATRVRREGAALVYLDGRFASVARDQT